MDQNRLYNKTRGIALAPSKVFVNVIDKSFGRFLIFHIFTPVESYKVRILGFFKQKKSFLCRNQMKIHFLHFQNL